MQHIKFKHSMAKMVEIKIYKGQRGGYFQRNSGKISGFNQNVI